MSEEPCPMPAPPELTLEQKATNAETWDHIDLVSRLLAQMQIELMRRQFTHDRSKLRDPEVSTFCEFTPRLATSTYGSEEYKGFLREMSGALEHHYSHNRHHPEYFKNSPKDTAAIAQCEELLGTLREAASSPGNGALNAALEQAILVLTAYKGHLESDVNSMNLIDVLEMIVDWSAAVRRHNDGDINKSIIINTVRFKLSPQLVQILKNTVPLLEDGFAGYRTQADL